MSHLLLSELLSAILTDKLLELLELLFATKNDLALLPTSTYILPVVVGILSTGMPLSASVEVPNVLRPAIIGVFRHSTFKRRTSDYYEEISMWDATAVPAHTFKHQNIIFGSL